MGKQQKIVNLGVLLIIGLISGCSTISYYKQSISGHLEIMSKRQSVDEYLLKTDISEALRKQLVLSQQVRNFATTELDLPDNDSYREYVDLKRDQVVWVVSATEPFETKPIQHCFLIVGCLSYRGFYQREDAQQFADQLIAEGKDVMVGRSRAYSTLGWFDDPLLNTMVNGNESSMIEVIFHELAHQKIYHKGETEFNESFATAVAQEGVRRWYRQQRQDDNYQAYLKQKTRQNEFNHLMATTRQKLEQLYRSKIAAQEMVLEKQRLFSELQTHYQQLKQTWGGYSGYDEWMGQKLNNAHLAMIATYHRRVPEFLAMIDSVRGNMSHFYQMVEIEDKRKRVDISAIE